MYESDVWSVVNLFELFLKKLFAVIFHTHTFSLLTIDHMIKRKAKSDEIAAALAALVFRLTQHVLTPPVLNIPVPYGQLLMEEIKEIICSVIVKRKTVYDMIPCSIALY